MSPQGKRTSKHELVIFQENNPRDEVGSLGSSFHDMSLDEKEDAQLSEEDNAFVME